MATSRMIGTSVLLPAKVYRAMKAQARCNGLTLGELLRERVAEFHKDVLSARRSKIRAASKRRAP